MTPEQIAALVGAVVLCLGNFTALIKVWADNAKTIKDRIATKLERDKDSVELHDKVLKLEFATQQLRDNQTLTAQVVDETLPLAQRNSRRFRLPGRYWSRAI